MASAALRRSVLWSRASLDTDTAIKHWTGQITTIDGIPVEKVGASNAQYGQRLIHQPLGME